MINTDPQEFVYGISLFLKIVLVLPFIIIFLEVISIWLMIKNWNLREMSTIGLVYQTIVTIATLAFIPWLMYWNLIGFNY